MAHSKPSEDWVTTKGAALACGTTLRNFLRWDIEPVAVIGRKNYYKVSDLIAYKEKQAYERGTNEGSAKSAETGDDYDAVRLELDKERTRLTRAQADGQELKNEIARHEVAPFDYLVYVLGKTANEIAGVMDALPVELMRKLTLKPQEVEKVKGITALAADAIVNLGNQEFLEAALDEFIAQADQ